MRELELWEVKKERKPKKRLVKTDWGGNEEKGKKEKKEESEAIWKNLTQYFNMDAGTHKQENIT